MFKRLMIGSLGLLLLIMVPLFLMWVGAKITEMNTVSMALRDKGTLDTQKVAERYAPILFQQLSDNSSYSRCDYICTLDFDGDWDPRNNEENISKQELNSLPKSAIYYSVLESESHFFITYSIFHPMDWSYIEGKFSKWYENDMKHLQVVVEKEDRDSIAGRVVFVSIQHREQLGTYQSEGSNYSSGQKQFSSGVVELCDNDGNFWKGAGHPAIFIDSGRHDLWLSTHKKQMLSPQNFPLPRGIRYIPTSQSQGASPKATENFQTVHYALINIWETLWAPNAVNPDDVQNLFTNDKFTYRDNLLELMDLPLYFEGDDLEGATYSFFNPNISPFALGMEQRGRQKGEFFFNPIEAYRKSFRISGWSVKYIHHPYWEEN